jgi:hypothetical protein
MRRKVAAFGALTVVVAVGVMIVTLLPASSATSIRVYEKDRVGFEKDINVDGKKSIAGDYAVYTRPLYRAGTNKRVGRNVVQLTFIRGSRNGDVRFRAMATFKFKRGSLEVSGTSKFSKLQTGGKFAITGGTGIYNGAAGTMVARATRHRTHFDFNIIP